jgi:hypothetical protein
MHGPQQPAGPPSNGSDQVTGADSDHPAGHSRRSLARPPVRAPTTRRSWPTTELLGAAEVDLVPTSAATQIWVIVHGIRRVGAALMRFLCVQARWRDGRLPLLAFRASLCRAGWGIRASAVRPVGARRRKAMPCRQIKRVWLIQEFVAADRRGRLLELGGLDRGTGGLRLSWQDGIMTGWSRCRGRWARWRGEVPVRVHPGQGKLISSACASMARAGRLGKRKRRQRCARLA